MNRLGTMTESSDWVAILRSSSIEASDNLIHTLGIYIAEATRFVPMKQLVAQSIFA